MCHSYEWESRLTGAPLFAFDHIVGGVAVRQSAGGEDIHFCRPLAGVCTAIVDGCRRYCCRRSPCANRHKDVRCASVTSAIRGILLAEARDLSKRQITLPIRRIFVCIKPFHGYFRKALIISLVLRQVLVGEREHAEFLGAEALADQFMLPLGGDPVLAVDQQRGDHLPSRMRVRQTKGSSVMVVVPQLPLDTGEEGVLLRPRAAMLPNPMIASVWRTRRWRRKS